MLYRLILLFLIASPMWPTYAGFKIGNMPILNVHRVLGIVFTIIFVFNILLSRAWFNLIVARLRPVARPVLLVLCFFIWRFLSAFASKDIPYSIFLVAVDFFLQFVIFIAVVVSFDDLKDVKSALKAILYGAVFVVFFGVIEYVTERNLFVNFVPSSSRKIDFIASAIEEKVRDSYRVQVAFMHPLVLAEYLIMVIPISALFLSDRRLMIKMCSIIVFSGSILVLFATGSRSGVIVLGIQIFSFCTFLIFRNGMNYRRATTFVFGGILMGASTILAILFGKDLIIGKGGAETMSTVARLVQLANGIEAVLKKPIFGYGQGFAADYVGVENVATGQLTLDNYFLTVVVESGVPALLLFLCILLMFYRYSRQNHHIDTLCNNGAANFISCSVIGFIVFCFILSTYEVFGIAFVIFGLILVLHRISVKNTSLDIKDN